MRVAREAKSWVATEEQCIAADERRSGVMQETDSELWFTGTAHVKTDLWAPGCQKALSLPFGFRRLVLDKFCR